MSKVTMQDIADALNVSRVSVWKVFNDYPGVSDPLRKQIMTKAQEMGYSKLVQPQLAGESAAPTGGHESQITVSVVVSRPDSSLFWMNIIHYIAKELTQYNINLMYTYLPSKYTRDYTLPSSLTNGTVQGIIMLNIYEENLLKMLNALRLPKVFLDIVTSIPEDTLTGDLVLLEGRNSVRKITEHLIKKGCTRIGFIGATDYARTNQDRFEGFQLAMLQNNIPVNPMYCLTGNIGIYTYAEEINHYLKSLDKMPEAFVCVSDFVANFVLQYLNEQKIQVPGDIFVSGYDGSIEYGDLANFLTSVQVDTRALGKRLVKQLLYKMNDPDSPNEVIYLTFDIVYGESTNL